MYNILPPKKRMAIETYHRFISNRPEGERIFLMTDNPDGQREFVESYGKNNRVVVYDIIRHPPPPVNTTNGNASALSEEFRFTTLKHTVIDIIIAAHAPTFKGSPFSSASELVNMYRRSHPLICCSDKPGEVCMDNPSMPILSGW
jgi:hypothetical protein